MFYFEKLRVYQESRHLVKEIYTLVRQFPGYEQYALCDQLRRAMTSVPSNIAEGVGRVSIKEKCHFFDIATGSLMETYCQLQLALDEGYISHDDFVNLKPQFFTVAKLLSSYKSAILRSSSNNNP